MISQMIYDDTEQSQQVVNKDTFSCHFARPREIVSTNPRSENC